MSILTPLALVFLITLPIIALMHMLRERRKVTPISSLILWQWIEKEVHGPRLRAIKFSLLLVLHLIVATLLALALSRPVLSDIERRAPRHLIIMLDASSSMKATDIHPSRFGASQQRAIDLLNSLVEHDSFTLIDMRVRSTILHQGNFEEVPLGRDLLHKTSPIGVGSDWQGALALANAVIDPDRKNEIYLLSDAAIPTLEGADTWVSQAPVSWEVFNSSEGTENTETTQNVAITTLAGRDLPSGSKKVLARAVNYADNDVERSLVLTIDGEKAEEQTMTIPGGEAFERTWTFTPGVEIVTVTLTGDDALPDDDSAALVLDRAAGADVLLVGPESTSQEEATSSDILTKGLAAFSHVDLQTITPEEYRPISGFDLYVFVEYLPEAFPNSSVLVIDPPTGSALIQAEEPVANTSFIQATSMDPFVKGIDLRSLHIPTFTPVSLPAWANDVVSTGTGTPLIFRGQIEKTALVCLAFNISQSNLPEKIAFPILLANSMTQLVPEHIASPIIPGAPITFSPGRYQDDVRIIDPAGEEHVLEPGFEPAYDTATTPGLYTARGLDASGKSWEQKFAINVGASIESDLRPRPRPEIVVAEGDPQVTSLTDIETWRYLVILSLGLAVVETWLAWR